ncbi:MAG TPA: NRDE family protein [Syntrophales bacterium]|nr:NRDE family protein [Syntrophales bacterium]HOL58272.1 NRDE family protein [Syntrophales bacterium]HPO34441.1 NRDE family protein [Syntrophales bacterium]
MCLVLFAYRVHPHYPFVFAANRDEFFHRPTQSADIWEDYPEIVGGRDLKDGGTWLGITKKGRFAAITNFRDPMNLRPDAPSRGKLVEAFLKSDAKAEDYLDWLTKEGPRYNGFNMIFGYPDKLFYFSNRRGGELISPGLHGLSNAYLNTPWPKVKRAQSLMEKILKSDPRKWREALFKLLTDRHVPHDKELPSTGVGLEWERLLGSIFISSPIYGTRSSTVVIIDEKNEVTFEERTYDGQAIPWMKVKMKFTLEV